MQGLSFLFADDGNPVEGLADKPGRGGRRMPRQAPPQAQRLA